MGKAKGVRKLTARKELLYVAVGMGSATKYGIGGSAALLDIAARNGLPVPPGIVLIDEAWRRALGEGFVRLKDDGRVDVPDTTRLYYGLNLPNFEWELTGPFVMRPAFSAEDNAAENVSGAFPIHPNIDGRDPEEFIGALAAIWQTAEMLPPDYRRDVLIQRMVNAQHAGIAYTAHEREQDQAYLANGIGHAPDGEPLQMRKLGRWQNRSREENLPPWARRLQLLLRDLRRQFNHRRSGRDWDIEWADDGQKCWLLQIRPLTTIPQESYPVMR